MNAKKSDDSIKASRSKRIKNYWKDVRKTIPMKIVVLVFSGGAICIFPFLVLHMQMLGITIKEIAILQLFFPIAALAGPVICGLIADKSGKFSWVFLFDISISAVLFTLLLTVPPVDKKKVFITCNPDSSLTIKYEGCNECIIALGPYSTEILVEDCVECSEDENVSIQIPCDQQMVEMYNRPIINETDKVSLNITNPYPSTVNGYCNLDVMDIIYNNITYESNSVCNIKQNCDYKCNILKGVENCEEQVTFSKTFLLYGAYLFAAHFFMAAAFTMMDASMLTWCKENNLDLGKQRIMAMFGFGLTPLLAGILVDIHSNKIGTVSYLPAFMLADSLFLVSAILIAKINLKAESHESNIFKDLGKLITTLEVNIFLMVVLILGSCFGFIESYLFIFLKSLNAPSFLLGLTLTVGCMASVPMLFWAEWFEKKIGRQNVFLLCFAAYSARMIGYSFMHNPWLCLLFECLEAFTYQLMWVTCLRICPLLAPKGLLATMTGVTGAIHYSLGKGIGGFLGGYAIGHFGIRKTYRIFAGIALGGGVFYFIMHHWILKHKIALREQELENEKKKQISNEELYRGDSIRNSTGTGSRPSLIGFSTPRKLSIASPGIILTDCENQLMNDFTKIDNNDVNSLEKN